MSLKKQRKKKGLLIFLLVVILAAAGCAGYYFYQRQQPVNTVKAFLDDVKAMDFEGMAELLQNGDITVLDEADITNAAYTAFFTSVNQKMDYDIAGTDFDILNGTANITAHIRYIDGSDIYRDTITEFLKQIVSTAFSGETLTEDQTQQQLASLWNRRPALWRRNTRKWISLTRWSKQAMNGKLFLLMRTRRK